MRRALVSQTRMPEVDQDRGSQRIDAHIRRLLAAGWQVTFIAEEENASDRHADRLRQLGVPAYAGYSEAEDVVAAGSFDLALLGFWQPASRLIPTIRRVSPGTRVVIDSIDVHFLREARRLLGIAGGLDDRFGQLVVNELNAYVAADAVLTVSDKEAALLADYLGAGRVFSLPLAEGVARSQVPVSDRDGILFVGNFRHLPNGEAVEYLCRDILPLVDHALLARHPLTIVGSRLDEKVAAHARALPGTRIVGWVPSVDPYIDRARLCAVPLLHGAGVKGKILQALMAGTPVVTTSIGAEGLDLVHGDHALIADEPIEIARSISQLLEDDGLWTRLARHGADHADRGHDEAAVTAQFHAIVEHVLTQPSTATDAADGFRHERRRQAAYRRTKTTLQDTVETFTDVDTLVLVVSRGDDDLLRFDGRQGEHFPQAADGRWAGYHPADSESAIRHLETLRRRGAAYLVFPNTAYWWLHHYEGLVHHLDHTTRCAYRDDLVTVFDLRGQTRPAPEGAVATAAGRVTAVGTFMEPGGPPSTLVDVLADSRRFSVAQHWEQSTSGMLGRLGGRLPPEAASSDWILYVDDAAVLPPGFVDRLITLQEELGADRAQPAHCSEPEAAPPVTQQVLGCVGRVVPAVTPVPVLCVRAGAPPFGPTVLIDAAPIRLVRPVGDGAADPATPAVLDAFVPAPNGHERGVRSSAHTPSAPRISVLVATFDRPELLRGCLDAFCTQTLDASEFEVIVVDDGSPGPETQDVLYEFATRLPLRWVRIDHAGRAAAKNLAVLLARGDVVLFFDDDDRPEPALLAEHLAGHDLDPDESIAVLGYTGWAPELTVSPLMHYLTEVDRLLFAYGNLTDGQKLDWRGFWEGRISCKRAFLVRHGLHDQRLQYSIDVELGWRLARHGLQVVYRASARSHMARAIDFDDFCRRIEAKGRAHRLLADLHDADEIRSYTRAVGASDRWRGLASDMDARVAAVRTLDEELRDGRDLDAPALQVVHRGYREVFDAFYTRGLADGAPSARDVVAPRVASTARLDAAEASASPGRERPALTVTIPVWSRTAELADMAVEVVERIRDVSRLATEIVIIDNGSPHERIFPARVCRFAENRGVATAWNTGIGLAQTSVVAVLNSDCFVEPGWDEALYEAVTTGRRIAFPYTDHGDGLGFRQPDQAGTAGWCFMLNLELFREIGSFDERFNPAYGEDTDYWHRAWELGIDLAPVPAARVTHARRSTARTDPHVEWLLTGHRYLYGWKHGVDPLRAPPYYNRTIVEYIAGSKAGSGGTR